MLLFGILGLLLVGSIVAIILGEKRYADELETCGWIIGILTLIALIICICVLLYVSVSYPGKEMYSMT